MRDYPQMAAMPNRIEPVPRRVRGYLNHQQIFDTTAAKYCWEVPYYPQYYIALDDTDDSLLVDEERRRSDRRGLRTASGCARVTRLVKARSESTTTTLCGDWRAPPACLAGAGRVVRGRRAGLRPPSEPVRAGRCAALVSLGTGGAGRGSAGGGTDDGHGV